MASNSGWLASVPTSRSTLILPLSIGGLFAAAFIVFRLQNLGIPMLMVALVGGCLGVLVLVRPAIGLVALIISAAFVRVTIGTGTDSAIVASLMCATLLLAGWVGHRMIEGKNLLMLPRIVVLPAVLLAGATLYSFLWGRLVLDPRIAVPPTFIRVQIAQAALVFVSLGLLFVGADLLRDRSTRNLLTMAFIVVGMIALPFRALEVALPVVNTAGLFGLWFVSLAWSNALVNTHLRDWQRFALGGLAIGWLVMAVAREGAWVSGWLPGVLALLLITIVARPRLGAVCSLLLLIGLPVYYSFLYQVLIVAQRDEGSIGGDFGRFQLLMRNLTELQDHLLFGTGPAGYALHYVTFLPDRAMSTHNNYVDVIAQFGVTGLFGFVALLAGLTLIGLRLIPHVVQASDRAMTIAIVGSMPALILSLGLGDWLLPFVYNQTIAGFDHAVYSWLMLASLCGLYAQYRRQAPSDA